MLAPPPARFNLARHCLADNARRRPDKLALTVAGAGEHAERLTFRDIDRRVRAMAAGLRDLGLSRGDRVMIRMANDADFVLVYLAAIAAGLVAVPSSSQLTAPEAEFLLADTGAAAVAVSAEFLADMAAPAHVRVLDPDRIDALKRHAPLDDYVDTAADDPAYLIYTSGTSARPKGVLHAHRAMWGRRPMYEHWLGLSESDVMLHAGALNWTYTLGVGLLDPWACGAACVLYNGPKDNAVWPRLIERYRATIFAAVPSVYRQWLKYGDFGAHDIHSLRHGITAGEALQPALWHQWRERTGLELYESLGMSEISTYISSGPTVPTRPGSPGKAQAGRRVAILPLAGGETPLPPGDIGLLAVHRSDPALMLGYWRRPEEEAAAFRGEWFVGGDLASIDGDGYVTHHGRADDVMKALGYRVSPVEVEQAFAEHPDVAEIAVAERRVRSDVAVIAAYVVPREGRTLDGESLLRWAADRLAAYKRPRALFRVDALPRTANGKVQRRQLDQWPAQPISVDR
jgi:acyl-coenzyme A synthetase/AMP-(fatty) acid ligase